MRLVALVFVAGCTTAARPVARPAAPALALAKETERAGRLVLERDGTAWDVHCTGTQLTKRPWQGGATTAIGACGLQDPLLTLWIAGEPTEDLIAIDGDRVARWNPELGGIQVTTRGATRTIALPGRKVAALAFDRDAVIAVLDQPGQIVRFDGERKTARELPDSPAYVVATGPQRVLVATVSGLVVSCDYALACEAPRQQLGALDGGVALADGGLLVYKQRETLSRADAHGNRLWTQPADVDRVFGAAGREVWTSEMRDINAPNAVIARSLDTGSVLGVRGAVRTHEEERGRYLALQALAQTPAGGVARGVFGGTLRAGELTIDTPRTRALCHFDNLGEKDAIPVPFDAKCAEGAHKSIETVHAPFVAINVELLDQ